MQRHMHHHQGPRLSRLIACLAACCCRPAAPQLSNFTTAAGITFMFNNTPATHFDAQALCNALGGNLAWFASVAEQAEAEQGFVAAGRLLPAFHRAYWLGLRAPRPSSNPADYKWLDRTAGPVAYQAWGFYDGGPGGGSGPEPDNRGGAEACGAGNFTEARGNASAWADASCGLRLPFMCRALGECQARCSHTDMCSCSCRALPGRLCASQAAAPAALRLAATRAALL